MTGEAGDRKELSLLHRAFDKLYPAIRWVHESLRGNPWFTRITGELWIGGAPTYARDYRFLSENGISAVLDTRAERLGDLAFYEREGIAHAKFGVPDVTVPDERTISAGVDWIVEQIVSGRTVLVHCAKGRGRSATVVAAYLMREKGLSFEKANAELKRARPLTRLEDKHRRVLEAWIESERRTASKPA